MQSQVLIKPSVGFLLYNHHSSSCSGHQVLQNPSAGKVLLSKTSLWWADRKSSNSLFMHLSIFSMKGFPKTSLVTRESSWERIITFCSGPSYWLLTLTEVLTALAHKAFVRGMSRKRGRMFPRYPMTLRAEGRSLVCWSGASSCVCLFLKAARDSPCQIRQLGVPEIYKYLLS